MRMNQAIYEIPYLGSMNIHKHQQSCCSPRRTMGFDPEPDEFPAADLTCQADVGLLVLLGCANMSIARLDYRDYQWLPTLQISWLLWAALETWLQTLTCINGLHLAILLYWKWFIKQSRFVGTLGWWMRHKSCSYHHAGRGSNLGPWKKGKEKSDSIVIGSVFLCCQNWRIQFLVYAKWSPYGVP